MVHISGRCVLDNLQPLDGDAAAFCRWDFDYSVRRGMSSAQAIEEATGQHQSCRQDEDPGQGNLAQDAVLHLVALTDHGAGDAGSDDVGGADGQAEFCRW